MRKRFLVKWFSWFFYGELQEIDFRKQKGLKVLLVVNCSQDD